MLKLKFFGILTICLLAFVVIAGGVGPAYGAVVGISDTIRQDPILNPLVSSIKPTAPSDLMVNNFPGVLPVCLKWKDNSSNETGFIIERSNAGFSKIGEVDRGVTEFIDYNVSNGIRYTYRVYAIGDAGKSDYSNNVEWVTLPNDPSNLEGNLDDLEWDVNLYWQGNNTDCSYKIQKTTIRSGTPTEVQVINLPVGASSYEDENVKTESTYTYFVVAASDAGSSHQTNTITVDYLNAPSNLIVQYFPNSPKLGLIWKDNCANESKYVVEKAHSNQGPIYRYDLPADATAYEDNVEVDKLYMYRIRAMSQNGFSQYSDVFYWYAPPRMPENFKAEAISSSEIKLTWTDTSKVETMFKIWRKGDNMAVPIDVGADITTYNDTGLKANTAYYYTITAANETSKTSSDDYPIEVTATTKSIEIGDKTIIKGDLIKTGVILNTILEIGSSTMTVNGETREIDPGKGTTPVIVDGRTLLPIRAIIESYGGTVGWDNAEQKVTVACNGQTIELWIGSLNTRVNGVSKAASVAPQIINERTMLPVRFISENLGLDVEWDAATSRVTIKTAG